MGGGGVQLMINEYKEHCEIDRYHCKFAISCVCAFLQTQRLHPLTKSDIHYVIRPDGFIISLIISNGQETLKHERSVKDFGGVAFVTKTRYPRAIDVYRSFHI